MATSGYIQTNTNFGYIKLEWTRTSVDVANNQSTISYTYWMHRNYAINSSASKSYSIVFNGSTVASGTNTIGGSGDKTLKTGTVVIPHNSDGTKTFSYSFSQQCDIDFNGWIGTVTGSGSSTLDPIARASQPTVNVSSVDYGGSVVIDTHRADASFTHTLRYSWNSSSGTIATGVTTQYTWTVPTSLMNNIPNATSSWGTIYCDTYNGSTLIGTKTVTLTTTVPASVVPTFTSVTAVDTATAVTNLAVGSYVQSLSLPKFTANGASGAYSSTISKYEFTWEGTTYGGTTASSYTMTTTIKGNGTLTVTAKITDSRGRTATKTANLTVLAYAPPVITVATVQRANSDGTLNDMGTYAKVTHNGTWNSLNSKNTVTINTYAKARGTTDWGTAIKSISAGATGSYSGSFTSTQVYQATSSYDFRIDFVDKFNTTLSLMVMSTGLVAMSWGPNGIGIGKVWQNGALDVYGDTNLQGVLNLIGALNQTGDMTVTGNIILPDSSRTITPYFNPTRIPANADLNNYQTPGMYFCPLNADTQTIANVAPGMNAFSLLVEKHAGVKQTYTEYSNGNWAKTYTRNMYSGTWGDWKQVWQVVSSGSNSNGWWLQLDEGALICHRQWTATMAVNNAYGSGYQATTRWTYPMAFSMTPTCTVGRAQWDTGASWGTLASTTSTYADIRVMDLFTRASGPVYITAMAIGRWV